MSSIAARSLGADAVLDTEHLENHGSPDIIAFNGTPVCLYGCKIENENSSGRSVGGYAFLAAGGGVGCMHP